MRPIAGYLLFAPCGPALSKLSASEITLPFFASRAAATMSSGCVWLRVPISSLGPHLPQFLYFSAASRRSCRVSLRPGIELPFVLSGRREKRRGATLSHRRVPGEGAIRLAARCDDKIAGPSEEGIMGNVVPVGAPCIASGAPGVILGHGWSSKAI